MRWDDPELAGKVKPVRLQFTQIYAQFHAQIYGIGMARLPGRNRRRSEDAMRPKSGPRPLANGGGYFPPRNILPCPLPPSHLPCFAPVPAGFGQLRGSPAGEHCPLHGLQHWSWCISTEAGVPFGAPTLALMMQRSFVSCRIALPPWHRGNLCSEMVQC